MLRPEVLVISPNDNSWRPATFAERGVAVPFTNPMLAGARIRLAQRGREIVVPHPAGTRGVYVIVLQSISEFCSPTLHDSRLLARLASLHALSPASIRHAAQAVAAEGFAGREAASAAAANEKQDEQATQNFALRLLLSLTRQSEGAADSTPEQGAAQAIVKLAHRTGRDADAVHFDVNRLAQLAIACGIGETPATSRCGLLLDTISETARTMLQWAESAPGPSKAAGLHVARGAASLCQAGRTVLHQTLNLVGNSTNLLNAWAAAPDSVAARLARPAWLLDGWESLCLAWRLSETEDQRAAAAAEACLLMPPIPSESETWLGTSARDISVSALRPMAAHKAPEAASMAVAQVARNERIRALAA